MDSLLDIAITKVLSIYKAVLNITDLPILVDIIKSAKSVYSLGTKHIVLKYIVNPFAIFFFVTYGISGHITNRYKITTLVRSVFDIGRMRETYTDVEELHSAISAKSSDLASWASRLYSDGILDYELAYIQVGHIMLERKGTQFYLTNTKVTWHYTPYTKGIVTCYYPLEQSAKTILLIIFVTVFISTSTTSAIILTLDREKLSQEMKKDLYNSDLTNKLVGGVAHNVRGYVHILRASHSSFRSDYEYMLENNDLTCEDIKILARDGLDAMDSDEVIFDNASKILTDFMTCSKPEHDRGEPEIIDILALLRQAVDGTKRVIMSNGVSLLHNLDKLPDPFYAKGYSKDILPLFSNLFTNSCQAKDITKDKNVISITAKVLRDTLVIKVYDNGIGIPEEHINHIFTPFFTRGKGDEGTGLGMFITKRLIEHMGGSIKIDSELGVRTTVTLYFPENKDA